MFTLCVLMYLQVDSKQWLMHLETKWGHTFQMPSKDSVSERFALLLNASRRLLLCGGVSWRVASSQPYNHKTDEASVSEKKEKYSKWYNFISCRGSSFSFIMFCGLLQMIFFRSQIDYSVFSANQSLFSQHKNMVQKWVVGVLNPVWSLGVAGVTLWDLRG